MKIPSTTCTKGHPRNPDTCYIHTDKRGNIIYNCRICRGIKQGQPILWAPERRQAQQNKHQRGELVTTIFFDSGHEALIDAEDTDRVIDAGRWHISDKGYARKWIGGKTVSLHQFVIGDSKGHFIDHINRNTLDCRKKNLRLVTCSENTQNQSVNGRNTASGIKNVTWCSRSSKWRVRIRKGDTFISGGFFDDIEAASARASELRRTLHSHCPENSVLLIG